MDANKHIYKNRIGKSCTDVEGLGMQEAVGAFTGEKIGAPFFRGTTPIYDICSLPNVVVTGACVMPAGYGVEDHRIFIVDVLTSALVEYFPPRIACAGTMRVNTNSHGLASCYVSNVEEQVLRHKVIQRYGQAHESSPDRQVAKRKCDMIDGELKQYTLGAEKQCRKIK